MKLSMTLDEKLNFLSSVPSSTVHIKPDIVAREPLQHVAQYFQESLPVSPVRSYQSFLSQQRGHATRQIKSFAVVACGWNAKPLAFLGPASPQTGVKAEAGLILKNDRLLRLKSVQLSLTPLENCEHPRHEPEHRYSWVVLGYSPVGASTSGLAGPSA